jgi:RNA polymerase-binding transcription factor DksA
VWPQFKLGALAYGFGLTVVKNTQTEICASSKVRLSFGAIDQAEFSPMIKVKSAKKTSGVISLEEQTRAFGRRKGSLRVGFSHSLQWMQRDMNEHEKIAKALKTRLSELRTHLAKVDRELHKPLPADSEDQAIELENQEALEVIESTDITEIRQIEAALKRISEGTYGTCAKCKKPIDPRRLKTLPTAATCISCSA